MTSLRITIAVETAGSDIIPPIVAGVVMTTINTTTGRVIEYSGHQPIATYLNILSSMQYRHEEDEPPPIPVRLLVQVFTLNETSNTPAASNVAETTIDIIPVNDHGPLFTDTSYRGEVAEGSIEGTAVVTVEATDADTYSSGSITYEIDGGSEYFSINASSGTIFTTRNLDAEVTSLYQFVVIASDNDGVSPHSSTASVTISVLDVNDNHPVFNATQYVAMVSENAIIGQYILTAVATDNDITTTNNDIAYELQTTSDDESSGSGDLTPLPPQQATPLPFTVDSTTGEIRVVVSLDYESVREYSLVVVARDSGDPPLSASADVTVHVVNENDESPVFTQDLYISSVVEDVALGSAILSVLATDGDSDSVQYSIEDNEYLAIDPLSGDVSLKRAVDFSLTPSLTAVVIANDTGLPPRTSTATVSIEVIDINNNAPVFSEDSYTFTVTEEEEGAEAEIEATDADQDQITYLPIEGFGDTFALNATTGIITISPLDYETQSMYTLVATATDDMFNTTAIITVVVEDVNDNAPSFISTQFTATIPESVAGGSLVVQVRAEDRDTGSNAVIVYGILEGDGVFAIEPDTGIITIEGAVDFETNSGPFDIRVIAANVEPPFWNDTSVVSVTVTDSNDNHPVLSLSPLSYTYTEQSPPLPIALQLTVTDVDSHPLTGCDLTLTRGVCRLSSDELSRACGVSSECETQCAEEIAIDTSLLPPGVMTEVLSNTTAQTLRVVGDVSAAVYQSILASLTYSNLALEPSPGERSVSIQCHDDQFSSNALQLSIDIALTNDNPITIEAASQRLRFVEGEDAILPVGRAAGIQLMDVDAGSEVAWVRVTLENARETERESVSVDPVTVTDGGEVEVGNDILINRTSSLQNYQVHTCIATI